MRRELEIWSRLATGWTRRVVTEGSVRLAMGADLDVERLYADLPA